MQIERKHLALFIFIFIASITGYYFVLAWFINQTLEVKWIAFCIFFGSCIAAAVFGWQIENIAKLLKKRHATKKRKLRLCGRFGRKLRGKHIVDTPVVVDYSVKANPAFTPQKLGATYMQKKLEELKNLSVKGIDHE